MTDTSKFEGQCETPMSDHVARFWQLVREFEVRIVVDQMTDGFGGKGFYATSIFSNDAAKAILSTNEKLTAENARLREAHKENARLLTLVAHDLQGRVEGGKLAAIVQCADRSRAALTQSQE